MCVMASFKEKANERKEGEEEEKKKKFPKKGELALASSTKGTPTVSLSLSVFSIYLQTKDKRASSSFGAMPEREGEIFSFEASDDANRGRRSKTSSFSYSSTDGRAGAAGSMKPIERSFAFFLCSRDRMARYALLTCTWVRVASFSLSLLQLLLYALACSEQTDLIDTKSILRKVGERERAKKKCCNE